MSKKRLKKTWRCTECKDWDLNPHVCKHLEKLIGEPQGAVSLSYRPNMDVYLADQSFIFIPEKVLDGTYERKFRRKLRKAGLKPIQIDILVMRFFYEMSLKDISEEMSIISARKVLSVIEDSLKELKEHGFGK